MHYWEFSEIFVYLLKKKEAGAELIDLITSSASVLVPSGLVVTRLAKGDGFDPWRGQKVILDSALLRFWLGRAGLFSGYLISLSK